MNLQFTETQPTVPGYYLISYVGFKTRKVKFELVKLGMKPSNYNWKSDGPVLAFEQITSLGDPAFWEIRFPPECGRVLWSEKIKPPSRRRVKP